MVQILSGLITYLLLAIYCHKHHREKVSIKRVRELRIQIRNAYVTKIKKLPEGSLVCKLAEAHGNRTHLGLPSQPYTGFEVREAHQ